MTKVAVSPEFLSSLSDQHQSTFTHAGSLAEQAKSIVSALQQIPLEEIQKQYLECFTLVQQPLSAQQIQQLQHLLQTRYQGQSLWIGWLDQYQSSIKQLLIIQQQLRDTHYQLGREEFDRRKLSTIADPQGVRSDIDKTIQYIDEQLKTLTAENYKSLHQQGFLLQRWIDSRESSTLSMRKLYTSIRKIKRSEKLSEIEIQSKLDQFAKTNFEKIIRSVKSDLDTSKALFESYQQAALKQQYRTYDRSQLDAIQHKINSAQSQAELNLALAEYDESKQLFAEEYHLFELLEERSDELTGHIGEYELFIIDMNDMAIDTEEFMQQFKQHEDDIVFMFAITNPSGDQPIELDTHVRESLETVYQLRQAQQQIHAKQRFIAAQTNRLSKVSLSVSQLLDTTIPQMDCEDIILGSATSLIELDGDPFKDEAEKITSKDFDSISKASADIENSVTRITLATNTLTRLQSQANTLKKQLSSLIKHADHPKEFHQQQIKLEAKIAAIKSQIAKLDSTKKTLKQHHMEAQIKYNKRIKEYSAELSEEATAVASELALLAKRTIDELDDKKSIQRDLKTLLKQQVELGKLYKQWQTHQTSLQKRIDNIGEHEPKSSTIFYRKHALATAMQKHIQDELSELNQHIQRACIESIQQTRIELLQHQYQIDKLLEDANHLGRYHYISRDDAIKATKIWSNTVTQAQGFEHQINELIKRLTQTIEISSSRDLLEDSQLEQATTLLKKLRQLQAKLTLAAHGEMRSLMVVPKDMKRTKNELHLFASRIDSGELPIKEFDALLCDAQAQRYLKTHSSAVITTRHLNQQMVKRISELLYAKSRELFIAIPDSEITNLHDDQCPHYRAAAKQLNQLSAYVVHDIVERKHIDHATLAMQRWIDVANNCYQRGDFHSLGAIWAALNHSAVFRLNAVKQGLSTSAQQTMHMLEKVYDRRNGCAALKKAMHDHASDIIPYFGIFRTELEMLKGKARTDGIDASAAQQQRDTIKASIMAMQTALRQYDTEPTEHLLLKQISSLEYDSKYEDAVYQTSLSLQPRGISLSPSKLFTKLPQLFDAVATESLPEHAKLDKLINHTLIDFILDRVISTQQLSDTLIEQINQTSKTATSDRKLQNMLHDAGISLSLDEVHAINHENKQYRYHDMIQNQVLRNLLKDMHLKSTSHRWLWTPTAKIIKKINHACQFHISDKELTKLLSKVGVTLSPAQLKSVQQRNHQMIELHNHGSILHEAFDYTKAHPAKVALGALAGVAAVKLLPLAAGAAVLAKVGLGASAGATGTAYMSSHRFSLFSRKKSRAHTLTEVEMQQLIDTDEDQSVDPKHTPMLTH